MSTVKTIGTVLKRFQQDAVKNGTAVLTTCLTELSKVRSTQDYDKSKRLIVGDVGAILFEAPTGTGKTLMAGHVVENLSQLFRTSNLPKIIWFWFAPFTGLIEQSIRTIQTEFDSLRPKNPTIDRDPTDLKSGDVFVTTWASVAVSNEASRKARTGTEIMPSIDDLIEYARTQGFAIGVVIDEAHHSFRGQSQAFNFYQNVLSPDLTILATATPRDSDVEEFARATGITNLRRITVSRQQAVTDRLIKEGVKVAVFKVPDDVQGLIDFKKTALKQGVATHNRVKQAIVDLGLSVTPLLLVQIASETGSVEQTTQWLKELGFRTEGESGLIRSHTADEPDPYLSTIAADESVEVLIFKMAVAIGFDAPRAFTLVSFRPSRDPDFGVQIVGRILRVDRRLQAVDKLPALLRNGYVFLSDNAGQTGLTNAAQRINAIRTELASVTTNIAVVSIGGDEPSVQVTKDGQTSLLHDAGQFGVAAGSADSDGSLASCDATSLAETPGAAGTSLQDALFDGWGLAPPAQSGAEDGDVIASAVPVESYNYLLRLELGAPLAFKRAVLSLESADIVREIVTRFRFDDDALIVAQQSATKIFMEGVEIFANQKERTESIRADLAQKEIDNRAQMALIKADEYDVVDIRLLHKALSEQLKLELERKGVDQHFDTPERVRAGLHKIMAMRPQQLRRAISEAVAQHTTSKEAANIPKSVKSPERLDPSILNLYGVFPDDLNTWERPFAEYLDNDLSNTVRWWHRNPPRKPFSVSLPLPGQPQFFPDFVVGIQNRRKENGILLVETKRVINDPEGNAQVKAQAKHPDYGKVMMIYWLEKREWQIVEYDERADKNFLDRVLRTELMATY